MSYPINKYRFAQKTTKTGAKRVIAISTYAGKTVKGIADCDPNDTFDLEKGKALAAARCAAKIAERREQRAARKYEEADKALYAAERFFDRMGDYLDDAITAKYEAYDDVDELLSSY